MCVLRTCVGTDPLSPEGHQDIFHPDIYRSCVAFITHDPHVVFKQTTKDRLSRGGSCFFPRVTDGFIGAREGAMEIREAEGYIWQKTADLHTANYKTCLFTEAKKRYTL